jgi:hypothetical protein
MINKLRVTAIILLIFNSISALGGGAMLIIDPTGDLIQLPIEYLDQSPFGNFLIPGILLFTLNGVLSAIIAFAVLKKYRLYPQLIILQGLILAVWLSVQIIIIRDFYAPMHVTCYLVAVGLIVSGALLTRAKESHQMLT